MVDKSDIGVIVIGLGMAGKVRVRDLKERTCKLCLRGVVSRRPVDLENVTAMTLEEALNRADVDAVMISTEPALHESYARQALEKGKHVLVEYPLATSAEAAKQLFKLAEDKGLILCEENIALLTEGFLAAKEKANAFGLKKATYSLSGSFNGWLEDFEGSGLPFITGVSGIQTMIALFGDLIVKGGRMEKSEESFEAQAFLQTQSGSPIEIKLARTKSKEVRRNKQVIYEFEDGEVLDPTKVAQKTTKRGLFMQDMELFEQMIVKGKICQETKRLSIRSLEIAEKIHSFF